jgi:hypothetical protein
MLDLTYSVLLIDIFLMFDWDKSKSYVEYDIFRGTLVKRSIVK